MHLRNIKTGNYRWVICAVLFFSTTINYLDKQVLGLLSPMLSENFFWSETDYATITSTFQLVYAFGLLVMGRMIDKVGTKWGFTITIVIWSIGGIIHAFAVSIGGWTVDILALVGLGGLSISVVGFMVSRAILGVGEAGNFPAALKAIAEYFPQKERALATGVINTGTNVGAILSPLAAPWLAIHFGWEWAFIIMGSIGFIWLIFWFRFYEIPEKQKRLTPSEYAYIRENTEENPLPLVTDSYKQVSWIKLFKYRQTWAFSIGKFMGDGAWLFFLYWLPKYLDALYGIRGIATALPLGVVYSLTTIGCLVGGWLPMYLINKGECVFKARKNTMLLVSFFPLLVLLAHPLREFSYWIPVLIIAIGTTAHQAWSVNILNLPSDDFPVYAVGSVGGIGGMAGALGGVAFTQVGGVLLDHYKALGHIETGFAIMFGFCACGYIFAWVIMHLLVPKHNIIDI